MIKTLTRKLTATFLAMAMAVVIMPFSASAVDSGTGWTIDDDGKLTISSDAGMTDWIASRDAYGYKVISVEIKSGVTSIGENAFKDSCGNLKSITIPSSVTSIASRAFYDCRSLESVFIPESVTSIGDAVFVWCRSLKSINIPSSVKSIGSGTFIECIGLESINIPPSVTSLGNYMFQYCTSLKSITIPSSITRIDRGAFQMCPVLETVIFDGDSKLTTIDQSTFYGCSSLSSITIPSSVTSILDYAFYNCTNLKTIEFLGNVPPNISSSMVFTNCDAISKIYVPNGAADAYEANLTEIFPIPEDFVVEGYVVNVNNGSGSGFYDADDIVTITATIPADKIFDKWTTTTAGVTFANADSAATTFEMIEDNVTAIATFKDKPPVIPTPPSTGDSSYTSPQPSVAGGTGWIAVNNAIANAQEGSDVAINMNGGTELPKSVLDAVKGKDINLVITMSNGYVWTINGKDIINAKDIDLTVKKPLTQRIPAEVLNTVTGEKYQLYLGFEGDFGFKAVLTVPLGSQYSGRYANLFYYNPTTKKLEYVSSGKIGSNGKADLDFSHASDYVITITSEISTDVKSDSSETDESSESNPTTGDKAIPLGAILMIATGAILITNKKAKRS